MPLSRRSLIGAGGASAVALLAGCGSRVGGASGGSGGDVTYGFYGNSSLQKARLAAVDAFNKTNPGFKVSGLFTPSVDYWTKLSTQIAAGTVPDVVATSNPYTTAYAQKNVLADLGQYSDILNPDGFVPDLVAQGKVDGKLVSLPMSINALGTIYDSVVAASLGVKIPTSWTWDQYIATAKQVHDASKGQLAGTEDFGPNYTVFELYVRGLGLSMYKSRSELGFTADNLGDWFNMWDPLRKSGAAVSASVTAGYKLGDWPNSPLILKKALMQYCASNNVEGIQALTNNKLLLTTPPATGNDTGNKLGSASYVGIFARSKSPQNAAKFLSWLTSSADASKVLGMASGPPAFTKLTDSLDTSNFSEIDKTELAYIDAQRKASLRPGPTIFPAGGQQIQDLFVRTYQDVSFSRATIPNAVKSFFNQAPSMLAS